MGAFKTVLCPIDFSDTSGHAVRYARQIASRHGAQLVIQHVCAPPALPEVAFTLSTSELDRLSEETKAFAHQAGCTDLILNIAIDVGRAADETVGRAAREGIDLLAMGTHGASGFKRLVLGSVTETVLRRVQCPTVTVPPGANEPHTALPFRHILCAIDFNDWSLAALDLAATLAAPSGATVIAFHVIEWPWPDPPAPTFADLPAKQADALQEYRRYVVAQATARLRAAISTVVDERCPVTIEVAHGKPHVELVRVANQRQVELIALGVHG
ncbi:MAG: hypothetical protein FJW27_05330 [Acidimicrobiia bacterium]|nr:hypothetical protein [Acidimicrobiia bacterium]